MKKLYSFFSVLTMLALTALQAFAIDDKTPPPVDPACNFTVSVGYSGPSPLCQGSDFTLTATPNKNKVSYYWDGPHGFESADQNPSIFGATDAQHSGKYRLTATVTAGSCLGQLAFAEITINVDEPIVSISASHSVRCLGQAVNLTANGNGAYLSWSKSSGMAGTFSSSTSSPTVYTPSAGGSGNLILRMTTWAGCTAITSVPLTVNAPVAQITKSVISECQGQIVSLAASNTGVTFPNSPSGIAWTSNPPGTFSSTNSSPVLFNSSTIGLTSITLTITAAGCSATATTTLSSMATPGVTAQSNSAVCNGGTIGLTASTSVTGNFAWAGPASFSSTQQNPNLTSANPGNNGTYSVTMTIITGPCTGYTASSTVAVTVNASNSASISASLSTLCLEQSTSLTGSITPNGNSVGSSLASRSWFASNGSFNSSGSNPTIYTPTAAGTHSVSLTIRSDGGCIGTATTTISVQAKPVVTGSNNSPLCAGSTLNLSASVSLAQAATYAWVGPNSFSTGTQNPSISPVTGAATGTYSVTATVTSGVCAGYTTQADTYVVVAQADISLAGGNTMCQTGTKSITATMTNGTITGRAWASNPAGTFTTTSSNPTTFAPGAAGATTISLTVTAATGCTTSVSTTISVSATPTASASSNSPVCEGATLNLSSSASYPVTYAWAGPNSFSNTAQNPSITSVTTAASGNYTVTASVTSGVCASVTVSASTSVSVAVKPTLNPAAVGSPICAGQTLNLSASAGFSYSWAGPNTFSNATQNPSIPNATTAASGTYSVSGTVTGAGACLNATTSATVSATVKPTPDVTIINNSPACNAGLLLLRVPIATGATYAWAGPNSFSSTSNAPLITNITAAKVGTYSVTVTGSNACSATATTAVTKQPAGLFPIVLSSFSNTPVCVGGTINFTLNNGSTFVLGTYYWDGPSGYTSTTKSPSISSATVGMSGTYRAVFVPTPNQPGGTWCASSTSVSVTVVNCARIAAGEETAEHITLEASPNPTDGKVRVKVWLKAPSALTLRMTDAAGRQTGEWSLKAVEAYHETELSIENHKEGMYFLSAEANEQRAVKKIIRLQR